MNEHEERGEHGPVGEPPADVLLDVRAELESVADLDVEERAAVFERAHRVVMEELRALDLS